MAHKVWLITGASGGLGSSFAAAALAAGHEVACAARKKDGVSNLLETYPQTALFVAMDVTDRKSVDAGVTEAVQRFGRLDVVVNNAGGGVFGAVEELELDQIRKMFDLNVVGPFQVIQAVLPTLRKQRSGHIINISSMSGFVGDPGSGAYNTTKFAVEGLSEALAGEVKPLGIHVTIVEPGPFGTNFGKTAHDEHAGKVIDDYAETAGKTGAMLENIAAWATGNVELAGKAMVQLAESDDPPLRLPFGSMAIQAIEGKLQQVQSDVDRWRELSLSTDEPKSEDKKAADKDTIVSSTAERKAS